MNFDENNLRNALRKVYGKEKAVLDSQMERYNTLVSKHKEQFGNKELHLFSAPGRTELGGNHTDHNHGLVLTASVNLDSIAVCSRNNNNEVTIFSEGYDEPFIVKLSDLISKKEEEGTTNALIRGIASRLAALGFSTGGFDAFISSDVLIGSGLSSSASIEVLIGTVFNVLFNGNKISSEQIALVGQYAENRFFGKPCGLMDQLASVVGGIITIDFENSQSPAVEKVDFNFESSDHRLIVVNTGGSHEDLTEDYSSIPKEMKDVANSLGKEVCRDISMDELLPKIKELRSIIGDRAILRTMHFLEDNEKVTKQVEALRKNDFKRYLKLVNQSGNSSFKLLQNIYSPKNISEQGVSLALAITERYIDAIEEGACRVHGGGFAGTIQVFLPVEQVQEYIKLIESVFETGSAKILTIRSEGAVYINNYFNTDTDTD